MFWLVAPSVVAVSTTAILAGCAKGRDDVKRPKSSGSNRGSNKQKQSGKSTRKPGASSRSGSSRRDPKAVGAAGVKKSSRSKREGHSSKSGRSSKSAAGKPIAEKKKVGSAAGPVAVAGGATKDKSSKSAGKSSSSKRRSEKDKLKKSVDGSEKRRSSRSKKEKSIDGSEKRSSRSKKSKSKKSSRSKKSASKKEVKKELQVDKTQEMSGEDLPAKPKDAALKTALSPQAVSVTKLELAPVEGVTKHEIRIEPSELRWNSTGGIQSVAVYNHSNSRKALKIKCSDNLLYRVNPVHTFIPSGGSVRVDILRQNGTAKVDKIVIVAADAGKDDPNAREVLNRSMNTDMMVLPLIASAVN